MPKKDSEKRDSMRLPMSSRIRVELSSGDEETGITRDLSDTGVFVVLERIVSQVELGDFVIMQVLDMHEEAPLIKAEVVRKENRGIGVRFV